MLFRCKFEWYENHHNFQIIPKQEMFCFGFLISFFLLVAQCFQCFLISCSQCHWQCSSQWEQRAHQLVAVTKEPDRNSGGGRRMCPRYLALCPRYVVSQIYCVPDILCPRIWDSQISCIVSQIYCVPDILGPRYIGSQISCIVSQIYCVPDVLHWAMHWWGGSDFLLGGQNVFMRKSFRLGHRCVVWNVFCLNILGQNVF